MSVAGWVCSWVVITDTSMRVTRLPDGHAARLQSGCSDLRMIRATCEQYVAVSDAPFRVADLWPFTERLERYGIAGFGWGATWLAPGGRLESHRDIGSFRDDTARERVGGEVEREIARA
jgi:hypothetical protein